MCLYFLLSQAITLHWHSYIFFFNPSHIQPVFWTGWMCTFLMYTIKNVIHFFVFCLFTVILFCKCLQKCIGVLEWLLLVDLANYHCLHAGVDDFQSGDSYRIKNWNITDKREKVSGNQRAVKYASIDMKVGVQMSHCIMNREFFILNCKPFYSLYKFSSFILIKVFIPPEANMSEAEQQLAKHITCLEQKPKDSGYYSRGLWQSIAHPQTPDNM